MLEQFIAYIKGEWGVLKTAPFTFLTLVVLSLVLGFSAGALYYNGQIASLHEQLNSKDAVISAKEGEVKSKDDQLSRYRVALGIDPASKGALIELSNAELALRVQSTVAKLRDLAVALDARLGEIKKLEDEKKVDKDQGFKDKTAAMQQVAQNFDRNLASDADNLRNELRRRLDPAVIAHVVRVPALEFDGASIPLATLFRNTPPSTYYIRGLADEMEQMAKLLPPAA